MKKIQHKSSSLFLATLLIMLATACGKQIAPPNGEVPQEQTTENQAPVAKELVNSLELQNFSEFDLQDKKGCMVEGDLHRRAIFQIAPKEAIDKVEKFSLILNDAQILDAKKASVCIVESECRSITEVIEKIADGASSDKTMVLEIDLFELFGQSKKTEAEKVEWIYANTTEYAKQGYRKLRLSFEGMTSIKGGEIVMPIMVNNKMPADFSAEVPSEFVNGEADSREGVIVKSAPYKF